MDDIFIIIPTLDPDEEIMLNFLEELKKEYKNILVVNDGSNASHKPFFERLAKENIKVLTNYVNCGKGRAIKNAFNYLLIKYPLMKGCVTCDCDGQHSVKDITKISKSIMKNPDELILGVRNFNKSNVPYKSRYGNKITRNIFKIFIGLELSDTQTGLRGFPRDLMTRFVTTDGERYEFETNMLIVCKEENISIKEVVIDTIYLNNNSNSHFNTLKDSIMIYKLFVKYFVIAFSSFVIDLLLFSLFLSSLRITNAIFIATILARVISSIYNYLFNSNVIFKDMSIKSLSKYYIIALVQMIISGLCVTYFYSILIISPLVIKALVDFVIWIVDVILHRIYIFKEGEYEE